MSDTILIRRATIDDAALLSELGRETFHGAFAEDNDPDKLSEYLAAAFNPTRQGEELSDPSNLFFIAEINGEAVGYAKLHSGKAPDCVTGENPIELARLYSQQKWIGHGVGAALMQACLDEARSRGCDTLWLGTWEINVRGMAFYNKWGFVQVGKQVFMLADEAQTDVVLQRPVIG